MADEPIQFSVRLLKQILEELRASRTSQQESLRGLRADLRSEVGRLERS